MQIFWLTEVLNYFKRIFNVIFVLFEIGQKWIKCTRMSQKWIALNSQYQVQDKSAKVSFWSCIQSVWHSVYSSKTWKVLKPADDLQDWIFRPRSNRWCWQAFPKPPHGRQYLRPKECEFQSSCSFLLPWNWCSHQTDRKLNSENLSRLRLGQWKGNTYNEGKKSKRAIPLFSRVIINAPPILLTNFLVSCHANRIKNTAGMAVLGFDLWWQHNETFLWAQEHCSEIAASDFNLSRIPRRLSNHSWELLAKLESLLILDMYFFYYLLASSAFCRDFQAETELLNKCLVNIQSDSK